MDTKEKDKMTYVPHRISPKQEFIMKASSAMQKNKKDFAKQIRALRGIQEQESFWERKKIYEVIRGSARL